MEQNHAALPMTALDEPIPAADPDGLGLMASLRARVASGVRTPAPSAPLADQYRAAMTALQALIVKRKALNASPEEIDGLEAIAGQLRSLARTA